MKKILVIEDDPAVREIILDILEAEDFNVIGAENGRIGVEIAKEALPNLIICDIMMPEMNGHGVLAALRQNPETVTTPFIFLTAKADKAALRQGMELGADDYLTKPFTHSELLQSITTRLAKQEAIARQSQSKLDELRSHITLSLPHELHTPLNGIIGISEILLSEYDSIPPDEILELAEDLNSSAKRLYQLIQNFLLIAQLEVFATDPERIMALRTHQTHEPATIIQNVVIQKAKQVKREADLHLDLQDATVQIAELKLKKIIEELSDNAFKFSPAGTPVIVTSLHLGNQFILSVTNYGRGMTVEQITNVGAYMQFERKVYEQQGSGLGLTIVKRLTELHGGTLSIESIPGKHTIMHLALPSN
jgi:two-component system sensor histidine kinase/response regulator